MFAILPTLQEEKAGPRAEMYEPAYCPQRPGALQIVCGSRLHARVVQPKSYLVFLAI